MWDALAVRLCAKGTMKRLAYVGTAIAVLLAVAAGVASLALSRIDLERFRPRVEEALSDALNHPVTVGRLSRSAGLLRPRIQAQEIVILTHAVTGSRLARIDQASIGLDLLALLRRTVRIESLAIRGVDVSLGSDAEGKPLWSVDLDHPASGGDEGVHLEVAELGIDDADFAYRDGVRGGTIRARIHELDLDIQPRGRMKLAVQGALEDVPFQLDGRVVPPESAASEAPQQIELEGRVGDGTLRASGTVLDLLAGTGLDLAIEAHLPRLPLVEEWGKRVAIQPGVASARLTDPEGKYRLDELKVVWAGSGQQIQLTGSIDDLAGERRADLTASIELARIGSLSPLVEAELPALEPVRGTLRVHAAGDRAHVDDIDLAFGSADALRVHVQGAISDVTGIVASDLRVRLEAPDLRALAHWLDPELQALGPLRVETRAVGLGSTVRLRDVDAQLGREGDLRVTVRGEIEIVGAAADASLHVRASAPGTARLATLLGEQLPQLGPVDAEAQLRGTLERLAVERATLQLGPEPRTRVDLTGRSLQLPLGDSFEFDAELRAPDLRVVEKLLERPTGVRRPVLAKGTVRVTPEKVALHGIDARVGRTAFTGAASSIQVAGGRRHTTVALESAEVHVEDVMRLAGGERTTQAPTPPPLRQRRLPVELLRDQDADLAVKIGRLVGRRDLSLEDLKLRLVLKNGMLDVDPIAFAFRGSGSQAQQGHLDGRLGLDAGASLPAWRLRAKARGIPVENVTSQFTEARPVTGAGLLLADLNSHGETGQQLLEGLDGDFTIGLRDTQLRGQFVLLLRSDLLSALALKHVREDKTAARCFLGHFNLASGVVETETLVLSSDEVILHGRGSVDLGQERLDLVLVPKARRPGIGLMESLAVTGSFEAPKVRPLKMDVAKQGAKLLVGNLLLPGVGTLAPFLHAGAWGRDPCEKDLQQYLEPE